MSRILLCAMLMVMTSTSAFAQKEGDWVLGQWRGGEYWFSGVVQSRSGDDITIAYDDGTRETVSIKRIRPYDWTFGSHVVCRWSGGKAWYAGVITGVSKSGAEIGVKYNDGDQGRIATGGWRSK